jgi:hypothetical protein
MTFCEATRVLGQVGFLLPETVALWLSSAECDAPYLIAPAVAHALISKYMVAFLKVTLSGDLRYAPLLVPVSANEREPDLGFVAAEFPRLGIPPEDRDCCFGYFPHARSLDRLRDDKNPWTNPCCVIEAAQCGAAQEALGPQALARPAPPPGARPLFPVPAGR